MYHQTNATTPLPFKRAMQALLLLCQNQTSLFMISSFTAYQTFLNQLFHQHFVPLLKSIFSQFVWQVQHVGNFNYQIFQNKHEIRNISKSIQTFYHILNDFHKIHQNT